MFVYTFDFMEAGIRMSTNQEGSKKIQDKNQRHILRDRRPSTSACSACWAMGTDKQRIEIVYGEKIFCTGPTGAAKTGQKSFVQARQGQRNNQEGPLPFVLFESRFISVSKVSRATPL